MRSFPLLSLTSLAVLAAPIAAQGILPYLPKDTVFAVNAPDISMSMRDFAQMPLAKMWAEEEVQKFFADVREMAGAQFDQYMEQAKQMHAEGALPFDPETLMSLRVNGGTFAFTQLGVSKGRRGPMPRFGILVHVDFGDSAPTWHGLLQVGMGLLQERGRMERTDTQIGDVQLATFAPRRSEVDMTLNVALLPDGLLIGTLTDEVRDILSRMQGKQVALAASPDFQAANTHLNPAGAECQTFMSMNPLVQSVIDILKVTKDENPNMGMIDMDGVKRAIHAMGLDEIGSMGSVSSYEGGKCVSRSFHAHPTKTTTSPTTIDMSFLKWVPKDAVSFSAGTLDVASMYDGALKGLQAYDSELAEQALSQLAQIEGQLGFTIRGDLFGSLGDHYINWSLPMGNISSAPEMAFLVKVNDQDKLVHAIKSIAAMTAGMVEIEQGKKRGIDVYQVRVNFDPTRGMGGINPFDMIQPTFSFKDGYMVAGFSASDVKRVFQRMDREDDPKGDIRGNKEFAAVASSIPATVDSLSFTDWKAQFESFYQLACGVLAFVPMPEDVPIDMALLPDSSTLTQHLFGSVAYSTTNASGTETMATSPFGPETWMALGVLLGGAGAALGTMADRGF